MLASTWLFTHCISLCFSECYRIAEQNHPGHLRAPFLPLNREKSMNAKTILLSVLLVVAVMAAGCTHFQQTLTGDEQTYRATTTGDIRVFFSNERPTKSYKEIGYIVASKEEPVDAVNFIKEKAATMGADALLNCEVRVHTSVTLFVIIPIPIHTYIASGVAVKYTNS